jgi:hypothetical protein
MLGRNLFEASLQRLRNANTERRDWAGLSHSKSPSTTLCNNYSVSLLSSIAKMLQGVVMSAKKPETEKVSNVPPFGLRMLPDLKDRIAASAEANARSMNAEIVRRLEESFEENSAPTSLDQIANSVAKSIVETPGYFGPMELDRLWAEYERLKKVETEGTRKFLHAASDLVQRVKERAKSEADISEGPQSGQPTRGTKWK